MVGKLFVQSVMENGEKKEIRCEKKDVEWKCKNKNIIVKIYYQALIYKFLDVTKTEVFKLFAFAEHCCVCWVGGEIISQLNVCSQSYVKTVEWKRLLTWWLYQLF